MGDELSQLVSSSIPSSFFNGTSKPYVRWWWLSGPFNRDDISRQLQWIRAQGFGGVELAWILPTWIEEDEEDQTRPVFLGPAWSELVAFAKSEAESMGLGCDFTFGSCWPSGGSWLESSDAVQTFYGLSAQRLRCSWEVERFGPTYVLNHLFSPALERYAEPLFVALRPALAKSHSALFCDSLELDTEEMWSEQLWTEFEARFGYSLRPYVDDLDAVPDVRYDYRSLISDTIRREFYQTFTELCHRQVSYSRVQCHGAPTDLLQAYAAVDIPESEALLFPPAFSRLAASAAAWRGKPVVSAEAFTCLYGFPGYEESAEEYRKRENLADLRLLADALFANGVNQIVWHGMPYQPAGKEVEFYASVHVGPDSPFAPALATFNAYLEKVSALLKLGKAAGEIGVYLPFEDALMLDCLPDDDRTPGANFHWEMRHATPPSELAGHLPLWVSLGFLREARVEDGRVRSGELSLCALYIDCDWLDARSLRELARLAEKGAAIIWKRRCRQPGRNLDAGFTKIQQRILDLANVRTSPASLTPVLSGEDLPWHWARLYDDRLLIFFAHPLAKEIRYPMTYGFADQALPCARHVNIRWKGHTSDIDLRFETGQSLVLVVRETGHVEFLSL